MSSTEPRGILAAELEEIVHGSVSYDRSYPVPPERVFEAFADLVLRAAWFRAPGEENHTLDFRVGGGERLTASTAVSGRTERIEYQSRFIDIAPDRRIVFQYESRLDGRPHAISLVTVGLEPEGSGTALSYTDRYLLYVYRDGADRSTTIKHHEGSLRLLLNGLGVALR